jgi:hypothetical protein
MAWARPGKQAHCIVECDCGSRVGCSIRNSHLNLNSAQAVDKEAKRAADRATLARGQALPNDGPSKPYGDEDEGLKGGIIIPLAPFGIPKYDQGERFDLKVRFPPPSATGRCSTVANS